MDHFLSAVRDVWRPERGAGRAAIVALLSAGLLAPLVHTDRLVPSADAATSQTDDSDGQIAWRGAWLVRNAAGYVGGGEHVTARRGASATFSFSGVDVTLYYTQDQDRGNAKVVIDGQARDVLDQYGPPAYRRAASYAVPAGSHTMVVTATHTRSAQSTGYWIGVDAFGVAADTPADPTATPTATPLPPTATPTATPVPPPGGQVGEYPTIPNVTPAGQAVPVRGQECPTWVHEAYRTLGPDGAYYTTWHPDVDPTWGCFFAHEHGSDPRRYVGYRASGMPTFGYAAARARVSEAHNGFKVYVTNDDLNGRAWMIALHQGTGSPARALNQFHELDWHISTRAGRPLVDIRYLADFGYASPNCRNEAIPGSATTYAYGPGQAQRRHIPTTDCVAITPYEAWVAGVNVGGFFHALPDFDVDTPTTVINLANLKETRFMCEFRPVADPDCKSPNAGWTGTARNVTHPGQIVNNTSRSPDVYTDPYGGLTSATAPDAIKQFITTSGWDTRNCCGKDVEFKTQPGSNGVYIAHPLSGEVSFGSGYARWPN